MWTVTLTHFFLLSRFYYFLTPSSVSHYSNLSSSASNPPGYRGPPGYPLLAAGPPGAQAHPTWTVAARVSTASTRASLFSMPVATTEVRKAYVCFSPGPCYLLRPDHLMALPTQRDEQRPAEDPSLSLYPSQPVCWIIPQLFIPNELEWMSLSGGGDECSLHGNRRGKFTRLIERDEMSDCVSERRVSF